jgi:DNA-binding response OmpR family regulator
MHKVGYSLKVLLVDDEPDTTLTLKRGLELNGFTVVAYNDPAQAIKEYKPNYYDFHVFDIRMPGMTGFDLARQVWHKDPKAQVCFLSAFEIYEDEARKVFKDLNTRCFVRKPIVPSALASHLQAHSISMQ